MCIRDSVKVKVVECDLKRKRIALTMRLDEAPAPRRDASPQGDGLKRGPRQAEAPRRPAAPVTSFAAAFAKLSEKKP